MNICFFNDDIASNFKPLSLTRPLDDFRIGIYTIREKWIKTLKPKNWIRKTDSYLSGVFPNGQVDTSIEYCCINSRFLPSPDLINKIQNLSIDESLIWNNELIACKISGKKTSLFIEEEKNLETQTVTKIDQSPILITYFSDLLALNSEQISFDISLLPTSFPRKTEFTSDIIIKNPEIVFIHESAVIEPGSILMAKDGPIYIGANALIEAGSIIKGPVAICANAEIKMGGRIFNGTTIGPVSKVGGEINNCIFHSYSNKAHDGFAGNSIIGQWCNFGAATNTSNLKNNYSKIKLQHWDTKVPFNDDVQFLGTIFGDFSKTAINTSLNTGTVCGVSSNIFCEGFPPKVIRSFSWQGNKPQVYEFDKAINAMQAMMARRGVEVSDEYIAMMQYIYDLENSASS